MTPMQHLGVRPPDAPPLLRATRADLDSLVALLGGSVPGCIAETVWQLPWTWHHYVVARDQGGAVVAAGSLQRIDARRVEIRGLCVAPAWRGRGLASAIVRRLMDEAANCGLDTLCVTRKPAFFRQFGFCPTPPTWLTKKRRLFGAERGPRVGMTLPSTLRPAAPALRLSA